ncbi:uncharacterized protein F4822DRAFT_427359 [Hypoxylon trugodes]|uniref:uncharacterized protein n=1 Tax=Hypoxylon trugodes TaxID=326681 RepID=UPI00218D3BFD|nr:uncharacterized protein F4822DRAFT_427359 [Hypoxylon trugodes]KAI1391512.1 hypothetical protein F4822DRAFT_427359 [Hypoxylon trugodes]
MAAALATIQITIVGFVLSFLSTVALVFRLWSRRIQRSSLAFDDYMAITAAVFTISAISTYISSAFLGGFGVDSDQLIMTRPWNEVTCLKLLMVWQLLWAVANTSVKLSLLSLYILLFPNDKFRYACYCTIFLSMAYLVSAILNTFLLCQPVEYNWDKLIPGGKCENELASYIIESSLNLVVDAIVVVLPMPMLFGLRMSLRRKFSIAGMFSLGIIICTVTLLRTLPMASPNPKAAYSNVPATIYSILEPSLGVVSSCLPIIKPALYKLCGMGPFRQISSASNSANASDLDLGQNHRCSTAAYHNGFEHVGDDVPLAYVHTGGALRTDTDHGGGGITVVRRWDVDNYPNTS